MTFEVRDHTAEHVLEPAGFPLQRPVASITPDASASEVRLNQLKHLGPLSILADREALPYLPSNRELCARGDRDGKAPLSVDVAGDVGREELATVSGAGV